MTAMQGIPVMLNLAGRRCVIVGGGSVAARRAEALSQAKAMVHVIAPQVAAALESLPVSFHRRGYARGDLVGAFLVVIATDDEAVNDLVHREAKELGVLVNRADMGDAGDLTFMARAMAGPVTLAVDSGCAMPGAAAAIRDELAASLGDHWPAMLTIAEPFRQQIADTVRDPAQRARRVAELTSAQAVALFISQGSEAFTRYCVGLARQAETTDPTRATVEATP